VLLGSRVTSATSTAVRAAVEATANRLAIAPEIGDLTKAEICSIANFDVASSGCAGQEARLGRQPPALKSKAAKTAPKDKEVAATIARLRADMESGVATSRDITQAYLDRIEFYDKGQFGFHAYEIVAADAMKQAKAADDARKAGRKTPLLGIPIAVKNLFDT